MMKMLNNYVITRHCLVVEEKEVTEVLGLINRHLAPLNDKHLNVANCGWSDRSKWLIAFDTNGKQWGSIARELINHDYSMLIKVEPMKCILLMKKGS